MSKNKCHAPQKGMNHLERQRQERKVYLDIGLEVGFQRAIDYVTICLHDPDVMGHDTLGRQRIDRLMVAVMGRDAHYDLAATNNVEADVLQEELDAELRGVYGDKLVPFRERYPAIKTADYSHGRKAWRGE